MLASLALDFSSSSWKHFTDTSACHICNCPLCKGECNHASFSLLHSAPLQILMPHESLRKHGTSQAISPSENWEMKDVPQQTTSLTSRHNEGITFLRCAAGHFFLLFGCKTNVVYSEEACLPKHKRESGCFWGLHTHFIAITMEKGD